MSASGTERIALSRHAALKRRPQGDVLVLPERAIQLSGSGPEILALCDGTRTADAIAALLAERYAGEKGIEAEVDRFLAEMTRLGGLEGHAPGSEAAAQNEDGAER